jgi:hypothetical protein
MSNFTFIIDTEQYAGNFEREMCAFMTGQFGECEVGKELAEQARKLLPENVLEWFDEHIISLPDERGCRRPVEIVPTSGWFNSGGGQCFREGSDLEIVKSDYVNSVRAYHSKYIRLEEEKLLNPKWPRDQVEKQIAEYNKRIEEDIARGPGHWPAYLSVGIHVDTIPPKNIIEVLKTGAREFASLWPTFTTWNKAITVTGFRLLETITTTKEHPLVD